MAFHPRLVAYLGFLGVPLILVGFRGIFYTVIEPSFTRCMVSALLIIGLMAKAIIWRYRHHYVLSGHQQETHHKRGGVEQLLVQHYHEIAVVVFGTASLWFTVLVSMNSIYCLPVYKDFNHTYNESCDDCEEKWFGYTDQRARVTLNVIQVLFYTVSMPFLVHMAKVSGRLYRSHWSYPVILLDISANMTMWLFVFFNETGWHVMPAVKAKTTYLQSFGQACERHETAIDHFIDGDMEHVFYPCFMELALVAIEIISNVWFATFEERTDPAAQLYGSTSHDVSNDQINITNAPKSTEQELEDPVQQDIMHDSDSKWLKLKTYLYMFWQWLISLNSLYTAFVVTAIDAALVKYFSLSYNAVEQHKGYMEDDTFGKHVELPIALYRAIFCYIPFCAVTFHFWLILNKNSRPRQAPAHMNITYVILTLCCTAVILLTGAKIVLVAMDMVLYSKNTMQKYAIYLYAFTIMESVLVLIQCLSQFGVIYLANSYRITKKMQKVERLCYYLAAYNFSQWAMNSFLETEYLTHRIEINKSVKPAWEAIVHIAMPLITYFRYISTFLLMDVKQRVVDNVLPSLDTEESNQPSSNESTNMPEPSSVQTSYVCHPDLVRGGNRANRRITHRCNNPMEPDENNERTSLLTPSNI